MINKFLIGIFLILITFFGYLYVKKKIQNNSKISVWSEQELFLRVDKIRDIKIKQKHIETPKSVRAVYMSSWVASSPRLRSKLVNFITESRINAVVLDIKDYSGLISFDINNTLIDSYGTDSTRIKDISDFIKELHEKQIYIIGRITTFQDPLLAKKKPEFAFKRKDNNKIWKDKKGLAFIDPRKEDAWEYFVVLAEESYKLGFDEINFDYIRYPSDGDISNLNYNLEGYEKVDVMKTFYQFLDKRLRKKGIPISADLFGFTSSREGGLTIGQNMTDALPYFDAIAPMVYPSHYPANYLSLDNPAEHPYAIVKNEMTLAKAKADALGLPEGSLRTWIQDFDLGAMYGTKEIQDQIKASYDSGVMSYMVWDPKNNYTKNAYYIELRDDE